MSDLYLVFKIAFQGLVLLLSILVVGTLFLWLIGYEPPEKEEIDKQYIFQCIREYNDFAKEAHEHW
jgi:hypothetical protein